MYHIWNISYVTIGKNGWSVSVNKNCKSKIKVNAYEKHVKQNWRKWNTYWFLFVLFIFPMFLTWFDTTDVFITNATKEKKLLWILFLKRMEIQITASRNHYSDIKSNNFRSFKNYLFLQRQLVLISKPF